jgi:CRP/FNR family transcriptional regulator, cyclic AMP receptor protein
MSPILGKPVLTIRVRKKYMNAVESIICTHPFWKDVNPHYLHILKECATYVKFGLHQPIFQAESAAEHFYLIHQGYVALETFMPGKGVITIQTLGPGEALGWSWLFRPYRWHLSARSADITEAVCFGARGLRDYAEENHDFGYDLAMRVGQIMLQRLQATRLLLAEAYGGPGE